MSDPEKDHIPINPDDSPSVVLELIYQLKVKDVMARVVVSGNRKHTMRHIQELMRESRITCIPITEDNKLIGLISMNDIVNALDGGYIESPVEERMIRDVVTLKEDMPLSFAVSCLNKYSYRKFPVLNTKQELAGMLSSFDVIHSLLVEMNREMLLLEKIHKDAGTASSLFAEMEFNITRFDFGLAGRASTEIKKALKQRNIDPKIIRRVAIASYEMEINIVVHSLGGSIHCTIQPDKVIIIAKDTGPGIADVNLALKKGWSTADEKIHALGFGAGMGLANIQGVSDEFTINSAVGAGTTVRSVVLTNSLKNET